MSTNKKTSPKITVAEIAAAAGVSPATVSRALNQSAVVKDETYQQIVQAMEKLGHPIPEKPAQRLANPDNRLIIINVPTLANPFYISVIKGVRTAIARHGYSLLVYEETISADNITQLAKTIRQSRVAGLITVTRIETTTLKKLASLTCVVQCCDFNQEVDLPYVGIDNAAASKQAVSHLIAQGKRRIAFLNGPQEFECVKHRLSGYLSALADANLSADNNYIVYLPDIETDLAVSIALQLLNLPNPPDAFFTASDLYSMAVLRACYLSALKVPDDVAIVGFDNLDSSKITTPSLSSVNQPKMQIGFMAGEMLMEKLTNPDTLNKKVLLNAELIVRESSTL